MSTVVEYRNVTLENVVTRSFDQEVVRDPSNTDQWVKLFTIEVETIASVDVLAAQAGVRLGVFGKGGADNAALLKQIQQVIGEDRGDFRYIFRDAGGDHVLMNVKSALKKDDNPDLDNGPKVLGIRLTRISPSAVHISFRIQVAIGCSDNNSTVLGNRWTVADDIDEHFATTRTWRGKLRVKSAELDLHSSGGDAFRELVVPPLLKGWVRTRMHFVTEPNGLELGYDITDREMIGEAAPEPACKMTYRHTVTLQMAGNKSLSDFYLRLDGFKRADKEKVLQRAAQILQAKLELKNWKQKNDGYIEYIVLVDISGRDENAIEASARLIETNAAVDKNPGKLKLGNAVLKQFGKPLKMDNYDPAVSTTLGNYPSSLANAFRCYLQSPCNADHGMPGTLKAAGEPEKKYGVDDGYSPTVSYETGYPEDIPTSSYNSEQENNVYSHYKVEAVYDIKDNTVQLPIARAIKDDNNPTAVFISLAPPTAAVDINVEGERIGKAVKIWKAIKYTDGNGIVHYPLSHKINLRPAKLTGDGKKLFVVDARYRFGLSRPPKATENWSAASIPWDGETAAEKLISGQDLFGEPTGEKGLG